jgi:hypothetical protein
MAYEFFMGKEREKHKKQTKNARMATLKQFLALNKNLDVIPVYSKIF